MKVLKKGEYILLFLLFLLLVIGIHGRTFAVNENITYKAEYNDAISYKVTITGLEEKEEDYSYRAIISQKTDIAPKDFFATLGPSFSIDYNNETKQWTGTTIIGAVDVELKGPFEKQGQYYIYVAKLKKGSTNYEMIDGPTKIATPELPALGERISIYAPSAGTSYYIHVNSLHTYLHSDIQRTIKFYLGEIKDQKLLEKLDKNGKASYGELLTYAKTQKNSLKEDSFKETKTGLLDYSIVKDYPIETGKYYFIYMILDNENGTYVDVEDIAPYNGYKFKNGEVELRKFVYEKQESNAEENDDNKNQILQEQNKINTNQIISNQNKTNTNINQIISNQNKTNTKDNTVSNVSLPKAGKTNTIILFLCIVVIATVGSYFHYAKYRKIK